MQRVVPGRNGRDDSDGFTNERRVTQLLFPHELLGALALSAKAIVGSPTWIPFESIKGMPTSLAMIERDLVTTLGQLLRDAHEELTALLRARVGPGGERRGGRLDGAVGLFDGAGGNGGEELAGAGGGHLEDLGRSGLYPLTVDVERVTNDSHGYPRRASRGAWPRRNLHVSYDACRRHDARLLERTSRCCGVSDGGRTRGLQDHNLAL